MTNQIPNYPGDYNSPLEVKQPFNSNISNPGCKVTYRTPKNIFNCVVCPIAFFLGFGLLGLFIFLYIKLQQNEFWYFIGFFAIWTTGMLSASGFGVTFTTIIIDPLLQTITVRSIKMFFCLNKTRNFEFKNLKKILIERDGSTIHRENRVTYGSFKVEFLIHTNEVIEIFKGVMDQNYESRKCFDAFRNSLPKYIPIGGDLEMEL